MSLVKRSLFGAISLLLITSAVWAWLNRQEIYDWQVVNSYTPTDEIAAIPARASMSDRGKFLFYVTEPMISEAEEFNQSCSRREATAAILGCYDGINIYIYRIDAPELDGIREVTAAHEMLHVAWSRLSDSERDRLGSHLEQVYERIKTDELEERMGYYGRQQPGERLNELHSILATEIVELDDTLERHYAQYFSDRQVVVKLHTTYETVFSELRQQSEALRKEIEATVEALNADITTYNTAVETLNTETRAHNDRFHTIDRTDNAAVNAYNTAQALLTARRVRLDQEKNALDQRQSVYQQKVQEYNNLIVRSETLTSSMNSLKSSSEATE